MIETIQWQESPFQDLTPEALYDLLALRSAIFVVEQDCVYQDLDGRDQRAVHILARDGSGLLLAGQRCLPPGAYYAADSAIGRIMVIPALRGGPLGRELVLRGVRHNLARWPGHGIRINAQAALRGYYERLGFQGSGDEYDEDGIPHLEMRWADGTP